MSSQVAANRPMSIVRPVPQEPAYLKHFLANCHRRQYPNRTDIVHPGDHADVLYYIIEGSVAVLIEDEDGREVILTACCVMLNGRLFSSSLVSLSP